MRHISLLAVSLLALAACTPEKQQEADDYTQYVNPFIGTDFTGNTYPGAQVPFGMVQLSPDNGLPGFVRLRWMKSLGRSTSLAKINYCTVRSKLTS